MEQQPDTSPDTDQPQPAPLDPRDLQVQQLTEQLQAAHKRVNELAHAVQAGEQDRAQFKERLTRERERMLDVEKGKIAVTLLEAVDQLDLCLQAPDESPLARGVKLIRDSILKQAEAVGIERVELTGLPFDPNLAEASDMEITTNPDDDGKVVLVLKAAYQLNGRTIRPGVVKVAKYVKAASA
jgi:molecular chaperone GrpE